MQKIKICIVFFSVYYIFAFNINIQLCYYTKLCYYVVRQNNDDNSILMDI